MKPFLIDGSLMQTLERRKAVTLRMAMTLLENPEGLASEHEAKRVLRRFDYAFLDVESWPPPVIPKAPSAPAEVRRSTFCSK